MRNILGFLSLLLLCSFGNWNDPISEQERKYAGDFLNATEQMLTETVKGLSVAQLTFKSSPERWSIEDCLKHIAMAEQGLWHMTDSVINMSANPEKRTEIKATDEQVIQMMVDRTHKAKAQEQVQPQNTPYKSFSEAMNAFTTSHQSLMTYVKETDKDLRDHVMVLPFGSFDSYQMILFIGGHSKRHILQMQEVKQDPAFPKK